MPKKDIDFRELLERILPLDELPPAGRLQVQHALRAGVAEQIEQAALMALAELERHGALRRLPSLPNGHSPHVRYQPRNQLDVITLELPAPSESGGLVRFPRTSLPQANAAPYQVRRLLRLDEPLFSADPRTGDPRTALIQHLDQVGRDLLGAQELRFVSPTTPHEGLGAEALAPRLAAEARSQTAALIYCPDTSKCPALGAAAADHGVKALVLAGVGLPNGEGQGVLEVRSGEIDPYRPESLALIALIADCCAGALERATRIEKLVFIDPLTGAYNRPYFELQVRNEIARAQREGASMALCIADIDNFKRINTDFGYEAGNHVLVQVAHALRSAVRPFDTVARWGGEEFAVLLTAPVHLQDVRTISERLRSLVERQLLRVEALDASVHRVVMTVSIGVAVYPEHEATPQDLWRAANQALLLAKQPPKNKVVFFTPP